MTEFSELKNKDSYIQCITIPGTSAATSGNYGYVLTARQVALEIIGVLEKHEILGTDAGAVTLDVVKVPNGTAISAGTTILGAQFDLKSTINTYVYKEGKDLSSGAKSRYIQIGESIALKTTGVLTAVAGVHVCIYFRPCNNGSYR